MPQNYLAPLREFFCCHLGQNRGLISFSNDISISSKDVGLLDMMISKPSEAFGLQAKLFRGLSDHSRLAILEMLRHGPAAVGHIAEHTGLAQSNASNHLRCLSECGLVISEQEGRFVYYRLSDHRIDTLLLLADDLLASKARNLYACTNYQKPQPIRQTQIGQRQARPEKSKARAKLSTGTHKKQRNAPLK